VIESVQIADGDANGARHRELEAACDREENLAIPQLNE
jgi:hypothetical protein